MATPKVTVVVPAYNCEKTILKTIQGLLHQSTPNIDIIVVDDGSTDQTPQIIKSIDRVKYIRQENAGPASARNLGAYTANSEFIFFTDSDCVPEKNWIEKALKPFHEEKVAVVAGSYGIINEESLLARCIHKEILFRHNKLMPKYPKSFGSYNFGVRKSIFDLVGGFDVHYRQASGEDNDLSYRILKAGYRIYFEAQAVVYHLHQNSLKHYLKEQFRHGFWRSKIYLEHPHMAKGDDYTFWKDALEVPLAWLSTLCLLMSFWGHTFIVTTAVCLTFMFILELIFSACIMKSFLETIYYCCVMLLRAFVRSFGFSSGIIYFLSPSKVKKT